MGNSYWSKACSAQVIRTPSQLQQANYGGSIFAVSKPYNQAHDSLTANMLVAPLAVGLTHDADCFVWSCCVVQRDVVFALGEGWLLGGCVAAAGIF